MTRSHVKSGTAIADPFCMGTTRFIRAAVALALAASGAALLSAPAQHVNASAAPSAPTTSLTAPDHTKNMAAFVRHLDVINYYPSRYGWTDMWTDWHPHVIRHDFGVAAKMGANTIRVITFPAQMGWPTVTPQMEGRLQWILKVAAKNGLGIQLTMFDYWHDYGDLTDSQTWTRSLLHPIAKNPALRFVEVQNEVHPSAPGVLPWVASVIQDVRADAPGVPVTVSGRNSLTDLALLKSGLGSQRPDFWDLHYYGTSRSAYNTFRIAKSIASPQPLLIGEAGMSTVSKPGAQGPGVAFDQQHAWFEVVENAAKAEKLPPIAPWTLYDFTPHGIPYPGWAAEQYHFGLIRTDDKAKPAAHVVHTAFANKLKPHVLNPSLAPAAGPQVRPAQWYPWYPSGTVRILPHAGPGKDNAVELQHTTAQSGGVTSFYTVPMQPVVPGQRWTATIQARGINATGWSTLVVAWFNSSGQWIGNVTSQPLAAGTTGWKTLQVNTTAPSDATGVWVSFDSGSNSGATLFAAPNWHVS
jgi:hypothetical protein